MLEHQMTHDPEKDRYICSVCGVTYHNPELKTPCIGVTLYQWGEWPEHLLTKLQMNVAGFQTGKKLPPPVGAVWRDKSPDGIMYLYDRGQGVPKKQISEEQKATLAAASKKSQESWSCQRCGLRLSRYERKRGMCEGCAEHVAAVEWVEKMYAEGFIILDVKTTGLSTMHDEIIQIAIIDHHGAVLMDTMVNPPHPELMFKTGNGTRITAFEVNQIHPDQLKSAPTFGEIHADIQTIIDGKHCLIYNDDFDYWMLHNQCLRLNLPPLTFSTRYSVMHYWASWHESSRSRFGLEGGGFTAIDDCVAILDVMRRMMYGIEQVQD